MAEGYTLKWNGDEIISKYQQAQVAAIAEVATQSAVNAAINTPVVTGLAQGSVKADIPQVAGNRVFTLWGSFDVNYYIWLELRLNMLRNAADEFYPGLAAAIRKHAKQARGRTPGAIPTGAGVALSNIGI